MAEGVTRQSRPWRGIGIGLILAVLVAVILLAVDPSRVPAADVTPERGAATPIAVETVATAEPIPTCEPITPTPTIEPDDPLAAATPVTQPEKTPEPCATPADDEATDSPNEEIPPTEVEEVVAIPSPAPDSTVASVFDPFTDGFPDDPTPEPTPRDPFQRGYDPIELTTPIPADPFEVGLPEAVATPNPTQADPTLAGFPEAEPIPTEPADSTLADVNPVETEPADPTLAGFPEAEPVPTELADPMLVGAGYTSQVDVIVTGISTGGVITPGGTIAYRFSVTNPGINGVLVDLSAATNLPGWDAVVTEPDSAAPLSPRQWIASGGTISVQVIVSCPLDASVGDEVATSLTATIVE